MMETAAPENKAIQSPDEWFVYDEVLDSYLDINKNINHLHSSEFKWFNFDIPVPQETPKEAQEREVATMQQVNLGILKVVNRPQQTTNQQYLNVQPPQPALAPEIAQSMGCIITPAFVSKINNQDVDFDSNKNTNIPQIEPVDKKELFVDTFMNDIKSEKYKFSLNGKNKIGKNEQCPCGSGLKFKKCHGR